MKCNSQPISRLQCDIHTYHWRFWQQGVEQTTVTPECLLKGLWYPLLRSIFDWDLETEGLACFQEHLNASQWYHFLFKSIIIYSNCHFNAYIKMNWHWIKRISQFFFHVDFNLWLNANSVDYELLTECEAQGCTHCAEGLSASGAGGLWGSHWTDSTWKSHMVVKNSNIKLKYLV